MVSKWYVPEPDSGAALRSRTRFRPPAVLTHLHRLELENAWQLKVFRNELSAVAAAQAREILLAEVAEGIWQAPEYDLNSVLEHAVRLAREHSAALGSRSLDIFHVAAALELGERHFVTGDDRQARLATAAGLRVTRL